MSAQVRTRLRFRHLGAAAVRAARRTRKSRSSSPPSPRRAAIPPAPTAAAGERRPALESGTQATANPKVPPGHPHPFRAVAGHSLAVSPAPTPPHTHAKKPSPNGLYGAGLELPEPRHPEDALPEPPPLGCATGRRPHGAPALSSEERAQSAGLPAGV